MFALHRANLSLKVLSFWIVSSQATHKQYVGEYDAFLLYH